MKITARSITEIALSAALISVSAMIAIPFAVPFTMQVFGVYFSLFFLGARRGSVAVLLYILLGALGLPVFSGFGGGFGRLFDAMGGFILGFLVLAGVYALTEKLLSKSKYREPTATALSLLSLYAVGAAWYTAFYSAGGAISFSTALFATVFPYILHDAVKIALAYILARRIKRILAKNQT